MMTAVFQLAEADFNATVELQNQLGVFFTTAQILMRRGLKTANAANEWLVADQTYSANQFNNIDQVVSRVRHHIKSGSQITIHGDYDVDGVSATTILVSRLRALGGKVDWFIPSRQEDGYGITKNTVDLLVQRGTELIITVDCGVTALDAAEAANDHGIELIITDHHSPRSDGQLPDALLLHPALCAYPNTDICAAGVAYRLVQAVYAESGNEVNLLDEDLDLVALATVADCVPLQNENRSFVRSGLQQIGKTQRVGLRALLKVSKVDVMQLTAQDIAFRLAPRINAAGRLYRADAGVELFLTQSRERADQIAVELNQINAERRQIEQRIYHEAQQQVAELGDKSGYVLAGTGWHVGVVGIIAAKIVEKYQRPAILIALEEETGVGSGRSVEGFNLLKAFDHCSEFFTRYGGHHAAAGCEVRKDALPQLQIAFNDYAETILANHPNSSVRVVDAIVPSGEIGLALAKELQSLGPFGMGNPAPRLLFSGITLHDAKPIGDGQHVRFRVQTEGRSAQAVAFRQGGKLPVPEGTPADAQFSLEVNHWQGRTEPQLLFEAANPCESYEKTIIAPKFNDGKEVLSWLQRRLAAASGASSVGSRLLLDDLSRDQYVVVDSREKGAFGVLTALARVESDLNLLVVTADGYHRQQELSYLENDFVITDYAMLLAQPNAFHAHYRVVLFDPPAETSHWDAAFGVAGGDSLHLIWSENELAFHRSLLLGSGQFRERLVVFYRYLRNITQEPDLLDWRDLFSSTSSPLPLSTALDCCAVLLELGLIEIDEADGTLTVPLGERSPLEKSRFYQWLMHCNQASLRYLAG